ncbi:MAG: flagellar basal body-associated FliL family protein [Deltaproteobacteria bacterium]|nr:flagellar basal body-associated FliL family protein [Deltaproteobacteria bacterium]
MAEEEKEKEKAPDAEDAAPAAPSFVKRLLASPIFVVVAAVLGGVLGAGGMMMFGSKPPPAAPPAAAAAAKGAPAAHGEAANEGHEAAPVPEVAKSEAAHGEPEGDNPKVSEAAVAEPETGEAVGEGEHGGEAGEAMKYKFDPFVINVFEKNSIHYLKLQVEVNTSAAATPEEIKAKLPQLRDALIFMVSDMTMREIVSVGGKMLLKEEMATTFNKMLTTGKITKVFFTEFTIQ